MDSGDEYLLSKTINFTFVGSTDLIGNANGAIRAIVIVVLAWWIHFKLDNGISYIIMRIALLLKNCIKGFVKPFE